jgi:hypothetical protein
MMCIECSQPVDPRTGYCTACGVWSLDLAASGAMPRYNAAHGSANGSAHAARPTAPPPIPEWGPPEPVEAEWELPPAPAPERPAYEPPPTGFESAPPPMAPRAFVEPPAEPTVQVAAEPPAGPPPAPPAALFAPAPAQDTTPIQPVEHPAFVASDFPTAPTPSIEDLFGEAPHTPAPAAPGPATPYAFLPPPRAQDRSEVVQPATDESLLEQDFDADPELTMIASRRGKTKFWTLDLPDGSVEVVVGAVIVGRAASPLPGRPGARLLSIEDPTRSVSKNHAIFTDENGVLLVEDLGSMNGIVVTRADGHETELSPGIRLRLDPGSTVELGDLVLTVHKN